MRIKQSVLDAIKLMSASEVAREIGCTETNIYYQIKAGSLSPDAIERYAKFLGRNVKEMFEPGIQVDHEQPFDEWLLDNLDDLPDTCFNVHGKVLVGEAKKLWLADIS